MVFCSYLVFCCCSALKVTRGQNLVRYGTNRFKRYGKLLCLERYNLPHTVSILFLGVSQLLGVFVSSLPGERSFSPAQIRSFVRSFVRGFSCFNAHLTSRGGLRLCSSSALSLLFPCCFPAVSLLESTGIASLTSAPVGLSRL